MKQLMWVSEKRQLEEQKKFPILSQQFAMDEMWHNFILFTKEYHRYCDSCYGHYLHHTPTVDSNEEAPIPEETLRDNLLYIEKHLGLEVVNLWYVEWAEKFSKTAMLTQYLITAA